MENAASLVQTLLHHLSALYTRESDQILQERLGIGFSQYKIMSVLQDNPASRQNQIAFLLGQTEASVSRQIKLLRQKGLLETKIMPSNRREHLTMLTSKGKRMIEAAQTALVQYQITSMAHVSKKQQAQLLELLAQLPKV